MRVWICDKNGQISKKANLKIWLANTLYDLPGWAFHFLPNRLKIFAFFEGDN